MNFTSPVNNLKFLAIGDNAVGTTGLVDVFTTAGFAGQVPIVTDAVFLIPDLVDLTSFTNITSIAIKSITDPGGLGFDDFTFQSASSTAVPEPFTIVGTLIGATVAFRTRQRLKATNKL